MTIKEIKKQIEKLIMTGEYYYVGIRYEAKLREVGEICENSKDNPDREDQRDFPDFESEEYAELPELDGASAWQVYNEDLMGVTPDYDEDDRAEIIDSLDYTNLDVESIEWNDHAYVIGSKEEGTEWDLCDKGEIVITDAEVLLIIK